MHGGEGTRGEIGKEEKRDRPEGDRAPAGRGTGTGYVPTVYIYRTGLGWMLQ